MSTMVTSPESATPKPRASRDTMVDWFRLFLAASVCATHLKDFYKVDILYEAIWAVPGFLAISGYYVLQSYEKSSSWRSFFWKRFLRVMPAFVVSLYICWLISGTDGITQSLRYYFTLGLTTYRGVPNTNLWSLFAEELCYVLLAILFTLGAYKIRWPIWIAFLVSSAFSTWQAGHATPDQFYIPILWNIFPSFFAGSLVYIYRDKIKGADWRGFVLVIGAILLPYVHIFHPYIWAGSWIPGLLMGVGILWVRRLPMPKIVDISYGVYIYQIPIFWLCNFHLQLYLSALLYFCVTSWYLIEKPALRLKNWRPGRSGAPTPVIEQAPQQTQDLIAETGATPQ